MIVCSVLVTIWSLTQIHHDNLSYIKILTHDPTTISRFYRYYQDTKHETITRQGTGSGNAYILRDGVKCRKTYYYLMILQILMEHQGCCYNTSG